MMLFPSREQEIVNAYALTSKQRHIMLTLQRGSEDGDWMDLDELLVSLPYRTTKQSLQFSIRALIERGMVEKKGLAKRRGRQRRLLGPSALGYDYLCQF